MPAPGYNRRILVIDDNPSIHADFRKILGGPGPAASLLALATTDLFGETETVSPRIEFEVTSAMQGEEGLQVVREAMRSGKRFAMAFVDVRMPPGMDGIETTSRIWEADPDIQIVICTAYSDYSWDQITRRLGNTDRLVILKKPFDSVEVLQLAGALTEKWRLLQSAKEQFRILEQKVGERTHQLRTANEQLQEEITERRRAEEALRATQEKLSHFLTKSPAVLYSWKFEGTKPVPAWISDNFGSFIGGEPQDWYERMPTLDYVVAEDRPNIMAGMRGLLERGLSSVEYRVRRTDGQTLWVRDDRKLFCDASGRPAEVIGCWTDVTEQRLLQDQLRQAQKMESVGQLAGGVAHDFNNLLMVIQGYSEMLLNTEQLPAPAIESLRQVYGAAEKAGHLTRQLLAFSRKQMMRPQELDMNELIGTVAQLLTRTLGEHIRVRTHCGSNLPSVLVDRGMIDQVIMNLAVNARDAMPDGGCLTLSTHVLDIDEGYRRRRPEARRGRFVCLSVVDNGCGIPSEHLSRLFEPFFTTKEAGKGTGLGLATVYGIVKQHEGWVEVESEPKRGTTFRVFLPAAGAPARSTDTLPPPSQVRGGQETVLLVEDEAAVRELVCISLARYGYKVHAATSGAEAIGKWSEQLDDIDLLITDVVMPDGVSGWKLACQLQSKKADLRIVYISGYNADMAGMGFDPASADRTVFLHKPFKPQQLAEVVRACLDAAPPGRNPTAQPELGAEAAVSR